MRPFAGETSRRALVSPPPIISVSRSTIAFKASECAVNSSAAEALSSALAAVVCVTFCI
ncbi:MAG TPA: hypothetical protein VLW65_18590 [Bryobacteraceae bacterium]|nr:hypothetical protein [Bryobacteraceae bacterium]